jgi:cbb3-type cytochrome oxidase subunit 3
MNVGDAIALLAFVLLVVTGIEFVLTPRRVVEMQERGGPLGKPKRVLRSHAMIRVLGALALVFALLFAALWTVDYRQKRSEARNAEGTSSTPN